MMGATNPLDSAPGTIRGDYALEYIPENVVHGSDSRASAKRGSRCSSPTGLSDPYADAARNQGVWTRTNAEYTAEATRRGWHEEMH